MIAIRNETRMARDFMGPSYGFATHYLES